MLTNSLSIFLGLTAAAILAVPTGLQAAESSTAVPAAATPAEVKSGYVEAGGIRYYYEIRGEGEPLLLLHGGLGSIDMFAR